MGVGDGAGVGVGVGLGVGEGEGTAVGAGPHTNVHQFPSARESLTDPTHAAVKIKTHTAVIILPKILITPRKKSFSAAPPG